MSIIAQILKSRFFPTLQIHYTAGEGKLCIVTGENATGKSILRKIICNSAKEQNLFSYHFSQQARSSTGIAKIMYGCEDYQSTGENSCNIVMKSLCNSKSQSQQHIIVWDEPEIGLSNSYAAGIGVKIREFMKEVNETLVMAFVISHNTHLIKQLMSISPHHLAMGEKHDLQQWLDAPIEPKDPENLKEQSLELFRTLNHRFGV